MNIYRDPLGQFVRETRVAQLRFGAFFVLLFLALAIGAIACFLNPPTQGHWGAYWLPARALFGLVGVAAIWGALHVIINVFIPSDV